MKTKEELFNEVHVLKKELAEKLSITEIVEKLLDNVNKDLYDSSLYKEILEQVAKFVKENEDLLNKSPDEIIK